MNERHDSPVLDILLYKNEINFVVKAVKEKANKTNEDVSKLIRYLNNCLKAFND